MLNEGYDSGTSLVSVGDSYMDSVSMINNLSNIN